MRYLEFKQQFTNFNVIKYQNIVNVFGQANQSQLKNKNYIKSARKGMYVLSDAKII